MSLGDSLSTNDKDFALMATLIGLDFRWVNPFLRYCSSRTVASLAVDAVFDSVVADASDAADSILDSCTGCSTVTIIVSTLRNGSPRPLEG